MPMNIHILNKKIHGNFLKYHNVFRALKPNMNLNMYCSLVTFRLRLGFWGRLCDAYTMCQESHYSDVLDNLQITGCLNQQRNRQNEMLERKTKMGSNNTIHDKKIHT